jgi:hypothetical protein
MLDFFLAVPKCGSSQHMHFNMAGITVFRFVYSEVDLAGSESISTAAM